MKSSICYVVALLVCSVASAQSELSFDLDPLLVNANRIEPNGSPQRAAVSTISLQQIDSGYYRDISDAVHSYPGLSTYRRTHSTAAHPTTQGVRIRNVGANATSRSLVIFDGVPQNDPFGSWIYWNQFDTSQIELISIYPAGGSALWGNMSSGGIVSIVSRDALPGSAQIVTSVGSSQRYDLRADATFALNQTAVLDIGLRHFESNGFHTLRSDQRGPVDEPAFSEATTANARVSWGSADNWKSQVSLRGMEEKRGNGTPVARNATTAYDASIVSEGKFPESDTTINLSAYFQDREFKNVFSSVSEDRQTEQPALDQYSVPAQSFGGSLFLRRDGEKPIKFSAGTDFRAVEGWVNERYRNLGGGFTRNRYAGGKQQFIGLFGSVSIDLGKSDTLSTTLRGDRVEQTDGQRIETDTTNDSVLTDQYYPDRKENRVTGNASWRHQFSDTVHSNLTAFSGFRAPTLNELYRPYRVRNDITESNPQLSDEQQQGIEVSLSHQTETGNLIRFSAFAYEVNDMVTNALLTIKPGFDPLFGFIPEGGSGSQRMNLDESKISGVEFQATQSITPSLQFTINGVYAKTKVSADELPQLIGKDFSQSPPWKVNAGLDWQASEPLTLWTRYSWADRSYEDLDNSIRLGATSDLSIGARYRINQHSSLSLSVTNALDEENVTGIATNGLVTIDEPRGILITYSWKK